MHLPRNLTSSLANIPDGSDGIKTTLRYMGAIVKEYKKDLTIRTLSVMLCNRFEQKDFIGEIKCLHQFVRDRIRYIKDVNDVETLQTPLVTLQMKSGDCDDKCTLLASMLESVGHPTRFVAVGFSPDQYEHVLVETRTGKGWIPLECTEPVNIGWYPSNVQSRLVQYI